jgi:hypothetical protein
MHARGFIILCFLCFYPVLNQAAESLPTPIPPVSAGEFEAALQLVAQAPASPFRLEVYCTDSKGIRSMQLFAGGVTIWNGRSQLMLPATARSVLLETLLSTGFASFETHYGGRDLPGKSEAAARISCRVLAEANGLRKTATQRSGGEQSAALAALAASLLDEAEKYAKDGVKPDSLQDALDRLIEGSLAPQVLELRFLDLTEADGKTNGSILRLNGGEASRQAYSPGHSLAGLTSETLDQEGFMKLVNALQSAQLESLPGNLWSEDPVDLEIQVLGHKKTVIGRPFAGSKPATQEPAQKRFATLVSMLRRLSL